MLTIEKLDRLETPAKGNRLHFDGKIPGFAARITANGVVAFVLDYSIEYRQRRYTIGRYPGITLQAAKEKAQELRRDIVNGIDPMVKRRRDRQAPTMRDLAADYFQLHANKNKRPNSLRADHSMLDRLILPRMGGLKVSAVTRRDIVKFHNALEETPYQANRCLALLSKMFNEAILWHADEPVWRTDNPVRGVKRFPEEKLERWLNEEEMDRLLEVLRAFPDRQVVAAILLIMLTGCRKMEALGATWQQFDFQRRMWTKPAHATKQKRVQHVPLSGPVLALLEQLREKRKEGGAFVFPSKKSASGHLCDVLHPWNSIRADAKLEARTRIHDLRHTFASYLAGIGTPLAMIGKLLGHTRSVTTERYAHLADEPVRAAAEAFGKLFTWNVDEKPPAID
jgi:integrase